MAAGSRSPADDAFGDLVRHAWPSLYRTAYLLLGDHGEAEDLVQTALAKTYASWHRVRDVDAAPAYARRVVVTTATSWFRRRGFRGERPAEELPEPVPAAEGEAVASDRRLDLVRALAALPRRQRAVVVLRFYDDLPVREVADLLHVSEGTVKSQTSHALAKLRDQLGPADDRRPDPLDPTPRSLR